MRFLVQSILRCSQRSKTPACLKPCHSKNYYCSRINLNHVEKGIQLQHLRWISSSLRTKTQYTCLLKKHTTGLSLHGSMVKDLQKSYRYTLSSNYSTAETELDELFSKAENNNTTKQPDFIPIYRFPYIVHARVISRFKIYHTVLTFTLVPAAVYLNFTGIVSVGFVYMCTGFFTVAGIMLAIISSFIRKIVGALYIDKKREMVKLSHLTFWSRRTDEYFKVSDIVPLSDTNEQLSDVYVRLRTFQGDTYYLNFRHGKILEKDDFMEVVGSYSLK